MSGRGRSSARALPVHTSARNRPGVPSCTLDWHWAHCRTFRHEWPQVGPQHHGGQQANRSGDAVRSSGCRLTRLALDDRFGDENTPKAAHEDTLR
jgi:hypothetical protein